MTERRAGFNVNRAYQVLGVSPGASQITIKNAYRKLVKIWHPDRFTSANDKLTAEEKIKEINAAYQVLRSDEGEEVKAEHPPEQTPEPVNNQGTRVEGRTGRSAAESFYQQGVEKVQERKYEDAIAFFTHAIKANPYYIEAYKYRGLCCSQLGLEMRATADLSKASELEWHFLGKKSKTPAQPHYKIHKQNPQNRVEYKVNTSYAQRNTRKKSEPICTRIKYWWLRIRRFR